ncbi:MAG: MBL fold metallo-hydrolase [Sandaracinaceae bacterium]|nr:MAG: MBL fold metallo-hydrolase [Sandaracinaceae bacterium]
MKRTHRPDVFGWSRFDEARDVDFHSWAWLRAGGPGVLIDPLPLSAHDAAEIEAHGPVSHIVVTNSDHTRAATGLAARWGAQIVGPIAEEGAFEADRWVGNGDEIVEGLYAIALEGSKTPGELALLLEGTTLICGDLVRGQAGGRLNLLPDAKLLDPEAARASVRGLLAYKMVDAVLVGDGWPVFRDGHARLRELVG